MNTLYHIEANSCLLLYYGNQHQDDKGEVSMYINDLKPSARIPQSSCYVVCSLEVSCENEASRGNCGTNDQKKHLRRSSDFILRAVFDLIHVDVHVYLQKQWTWSWCQIDPATLYD